MGPNLVMNNLNRRMSADLITHSHAIFTFNAKANLVTVQQIEHVMDVNNRQCYYYIHYSDKSIN